LHAGSHTRGVEPTFKFVAGVGTRLLSVRNRLREAMEAALNTATANQTEAVRDNTWRLERITTETEKLNRGFEALRKETVENYREASKRDKNASGWKRTTSVINTVFAFLLGCLAVAYYYQRIAGDRAGQPPPIVDTIKK
jgi:hypothetical protein